jgi:putative ABC transport system substrate-binding protein
VLYDSYGRRQLEAAQSAAHSLGIQVVALELLPPYDYNESFKVAKQKKVAAVILLYSAVFYPARDSIAREAIANRLPLIGWASEFARAGFFASYGSDAGASFERLAYFIDRVLKGVAPKDLPVEQPTKLELVINLRTAKAMGLAVAPSVLMRADEIIR